MITITQVIKSLSLSLVTVLVLVPSAIAHPSAAPVLQDQQQENPKQKPVPREGAKPQENPAQQPRVEPKPGKPEKNQEKLEKKQQKLQKDQEKNQEKLPKGEEPAKGQAASAPGAQNPGQRRAQPSQAHVRYQFHSQDVTKLRQHYQARLRSVDPASRPQLVVNSYVPQQVVTIIEPVPVEVVEVLPPVPVGYVIGYCDGFVIVYDPSTFFIVGVIDLL